MTRHVGASVLLVEDDERLAKLTADFLSDHGFSVEVVSRGDEAIESIRTAPPEIVLLDLMLPGASGFDVCRDVRAEYPGLIMMLTARDDTVDQIVGLEMGADDYVTKPVEPRVLLARLRALLRRPMLATENSKTVLELDTLRICATSRDVTLDGQPVELTTSEFDLLWLLASRAGTVIGRSELFFELRGLPYDGLDRSIDIGVSRLRRKLGDIETPPRLIKTVRAKGYLFVSQD